jgi:hypothetical protein
MLQEAFFFPSWVGKGKTAPAQKEKEMLLITMGFNWVD